MSSIQWHGQHFHLNYWGACPTLKCPKHNCWSFSPAYSSFHNLFYLSIYCSGQRLWAHPWLLIFSHMPHQIHQQTCQLHLQNISLLDGVLFYNQKVEGLIFGQGTYVGCGLNPQSQYVWTSIRVSAGGNQLFFSLSHWCFPLPSCLPSLLLKSSREMSLDEDKKKIYPWTNQFLWPLP